MASSRMPVAELACVAALLALAAPAAAQERATSLARLEVSMWPEYDRPEVLLIFRARLPEDAKLPAIVPIPIPAAAGEPTAVARHGQDGTLFVTAYTRTVQADQATIAVSTDTRDVQVEAYLPLGVSSPRRRFSYAWPGGLAVGELVLELQRPIGAQAVELTPAATETSVQADGLTYDRVRLEKLKASSRATLTVAYTKTTADLTSPKPPKAAEAPAPSPQVPGATMEMPPAAAAAPAMPPPGAEPMERGRDPMVWVVVGGLAAAFAAAIYLAMRQSKGPSEPPKS
jgi:hypothetical protein